VTTESPWAEAERQWRMNVGIPLAYSAVGFLRTNYGADQAATFHVLGDDALETVVDRCFPVKRMSGQERRVLFEEIRRLLVPQPERSIGDYWRLGADLIGKPKPDDPPAG
jgi:hypothetical protein